MGLMQPLAPPASPLDKARLRDGMARLASGVTLITCWADGAPVGLAATSLVGLSVEPPRLLFSVRRAASAHDGLLKAGRCAAVALAEDDLDEARLFAVTDVEGQDPPPVWWTPMLALRSWRGVSDEWYAPGVSGDVQARGGRSGGCERPVGGVGGPGAGSALDGAATMDDAVRGASDGDGEAPHHASAGPVAV